MEINKSQRKNILIIEIKGSFDINEIAKFESFFQKEKDDFKEIAFDFDNLDFIDSSGIGAIIKVLTYLKQKNGMVYIINLPGHIKTIFESAKLHVFLKILSKAEFQRKFPKDEDVDDILKHL